MYSKQPKLVKMVMEIHRSGHIIFDLLFYLILLETANWLHHLVALRTENILFEFVMNIFNL